MLIQENLSIQEKLKILTDAAKYDVACTSSGVERSGRDGSLGNACESGLCHSFSSDGRCISLLKILFTNQCIHDCKYCVNRRSNDTLRTAFTPGEVCTLTMEFYRRNYIEGLFLSSGILNTPDFTMDQIYQTLWSLRREHRFNGYIHVKAIPGADPELIERVGFLADRMSVNLELPTAEGLRRLAPGKTREKILLPMRQIQRGIVRQMAEEGLLEKKGIVLPAGKKDGLRRQGAPGMPAPGASLAGGAAGERTVPGDPAAGMLASGAPAAGMLASGTSSPGTSVPETPAAGPDALAVSAAKISTPGMTAPGTPAAGASASGRRRVIPGKSAYGNYGINRASGKKQYFVPAGQSTQMIVGATPENDYQMMAVAEALYQNFGLKRVFYSAYVPINQDSSLPALPGGPPLLREHRLYQADWLLRYYGFEASELLSEEKPNFNVLLDPKCDWAVRNLGLFPVEVNRADYATLLRVPGIGTKSAMRIVAARRQAVLRFEDLKKLGVVLKRAVYFITCSGRMMYPVKLSEDTVTGFLIGEERRRSWNLEQSGCYRQLSMFDDLHLSAAPPKEERAGVLTGQL